MKNSEQLIQLNNKKRELLTDENKHIYEDFLLYLRTDLRVAEYECEELLMDILDHLLEAQNDGKSAKDLFGDHPEEYAKELIANLPSEKKRNVALFGGSLILSIFGFVCMSYGLPLLILPFFTQIDQTITIGKVILTIVLVCLIVLLAVKVIFGLIRKPLFKKNRKGFEKKTYLKAGLFGGFAFLLIVIVSRFIPEFGPEIVMEWWLYVLFGAMFLVISKIIKKFS